MNVVRNLTSWDIAGELMDDQYSSWSRDAAYGIADYLLNLADDLGENIEFDVVAIRCEFSEYDAEELIADYGHLIGIDDTADDFDIDDYTIDDLADMIGEHTTVAFHNSDTIVLCDI